MNIFKTITNGAKSFCKKLWEYVPGGEIFVTSLVVNTFALIHGAGVLFTGCVAGIALNISMAFILMASPVRVRRAVCKFISNYGFFLDLAITVALTAVGFSLGATMGTIALFLGLNFSAFASLVRWGYFLTNEDERVRFYAKNCVA